MALENRKRLRRTPLSSEEVANIIAFKKRRELLILQKLKKSKIYKFLNIINIACFFIYLEILFCFLGPCIIQKHEAKDIIARYGEGYENGMALISEIEITDTNNA